MKSRASNEQPWVTEISKRSKLWKRFISWAKREKLVFRAAHLCNISYKFLQEFNGYNTWVQVQFTVWKIFKQPLQYNNLIWVFLFESEGIQLHVQSTQFVVTCPFGAVGDEFFVCIWLQGGVRWVGFCLFGRKLTHPTHPGLQNNFLEFLYAGV